MDANGNATAVWQQFDGTRFNVWSNRYSANGGWGTPVLIESGPGDVYFVQIAMNSSGNAIAVWEQSAWIDFQHLVKSLFG